MYRPRKALDLLRFVENMTTFVGYKKGNYPQKIKCHEN